MFDKVISWSLGNRWPVLIVCVLLVGLGIRQASVAPIDVLPDFSQKQVVVTTECPGCTAREVEATVTSQLESELTAGVAGVKSVQSISTVGLSVVRLVFEDGTDPYFARQQVNEKLTAVTSLPSSAGKPVLAPVTTTIGDILKIGLISTGKTTPMELRTIMDWTISKRLKTVPGVSNVITYGGEVKQYQILLNQEKLQVLSVSMDDVVKAATASNVNSAAGFLRTGNAEYPIIGVGRAASVDDIGRTVVAERGKTRVTLDQVATVTIGPAFKINDAVINGQPAVILNIVKQPWANTLAVTADVETALAALASTLPADVKTVTVFRQADFIDVAVSNVFHALLLGGLLVCGVLFFFLRNWRTAIISLTAIPLSLLASVIVLSYQGATINTMTLAGLAIAIGEVVDDAIIDVENIFRRLRENAREGCPRRSLQVVFAASSEIRSSVVYATYIVSLVFLPVFFLGGIEGKIFTPLAVSYITAIVSSLVVALTLTPVLSHLLLSDKSRLLAEESSTVLWLKERYGRLLDSSLARPRQTIAAAVALTMVAIVALPFLGREFLPQFDEGNVVAPLTYPGGTPLPVTAATGAILTKELSRQSDCFVVGQRAGRAEGSDDYVLGNSSELDVRLCSSSRLSKVETLEQVRRLIAQFPGLVGSVGSYILHRMNHALSGVTSDIAIKIFGQDAVLLQEKAREIESIIKGVTGLVDLQVEASMLVPQVTIQVKRDAARQYGITPGKLAYDMETAFKGRVVSQVVDGIQRFDLVVWLKPDFRDKLESLGSALIDTPSGGKIPIRSVADIYLDKGPSTIRHEGLAPVVVVQGNVSGRDLGSVIDDIRSRVEKQISLPETGGYHVVYGGQFEAQQEATRKLVLLGSFALAGVFLLLWQALRSWRAAGLVMLNLPLAMIGGVPAIVLAGGILSVGSLLGFVTLFGISTRNGIMIVSHFNHLIEQGHSFDDALKQGATDRLSPVLMTALCAALGVLPIALLGGAGREIEQPLAVVILGGMFSATALTLLVIPALFKLFGKKALHG